MLDEQSFAYFILFNVQCLVQVRIDQQQDTMATQFWTLSEDSDIDVGIWKRSDMDP